ncbi:FUSC family protein [Georgenia sp. SYP-B2076]|uniref:FUSC family protein n=1 Tax=Georgenia sp. SYP-B2076 TaxID=2495881 RepID=UPI000F8D1CF0|nr:FUSC family protein [Georgenia sp. SYP-B2076]
MRNVAARLRAALNRHSLTRPAGAPTWGLSAALAVAVGGALLVGARTGRADEAARVVLSMILVALPSIPEAPAAATRALLVRTSAVTASSLAVTALGGDQLAVAIAVVAAALLGFTVPSIGTTAALALLLLGLRTDMTSGSTSLPALWELTGALVVALATFATRIRRSPAAAAPAPPAGAPGPSWTARRVASVGVAVALALVSPLGIYGGHWLVTAVLLSVRPTPSATRVRLAQRLLGNTVAALLVALLMAAVPGPAAMALVAAGLVFLAFALRPLSYLWWAVTAPPVLLIAGDFPLTHDWYEGMVRVGLNVVGAVIVLIVCYAARPRPGWVRRVRPA